jgi:hypothetical protein
LELKKKLLAKCGSVSFKNLTKDVEVFLINPVDSNKITLFTEYIEKRF